MTIVALRITRPKEFLEKIIEWASRFKYICVHEIGSATSKSHFHIYIETDMRSDNFEKYPWKKFKDDNNLVGNEDFSKMKRAPKSWNYLVKGEKEGEIPEYWTNMDIIQEDVAEAHKEVHRWKRGKEWEARMKEEDEESEVKVESEVIFQQLEVNDSEAVKLAKLKLLTEKEKTKRAVEVEKEKSKRKAQNKVFKKDFLQYLEDRYEQDKPKFNTATSAVSYNKVRKWVTEMMHNGRKASLIYPRCIESYTNWWMITLTGGNYEV